jgi:hypothetical protein
LRTLSSLTVSFLFLTSSLGLADSTSSIIVGEKGVGDQQTVASGAGSGYGPQAPRDLRLADGANPVVFATAPDRSVMNLCNIHFHAGAEHQGGEFTSHAEHGHERGGGFRYDGTLSEAELAPVDYPVGKAEHGSLKPSDTIEIHYVHSTAQVKPGPTLASCFDDAVRNPQLRVEGFVFVIVNNDTAADMRVLNTLDVVNGYHQAVNMPQNLGTPVSYAGSTTGPSYNEVASPFQVTWNVYPHVLRIRPVEARFQAFSGCQFQGMSSSMRLIL